MMHPSADAKPPSGSKLIDETVTAIAPPCVPCREEARHIQNRLTKPPGSLGALEDLAVWAAGVRRSPTPALARKVVVVAAADHGVAAEGVSAYPTDVTAQMVRNFLHEGAAINAIAGRAGCDVRVVDAGVRGDVPDPRLHRVNAQDGTANLLVGPAMSRADAVMLVECGIEYARDLAATGYDVIGLGDMGIGNTTSAAAITCAVTGAEPELAVGRGTGIDNATLIVKRAVVERAITLHALDRGDALGILSCLGGFEIAFLAGLAIGGASVSLPVVLDGYPTTAAALIAFELAPRSIAFFMASHRSVEPGHAIALDHLGLHPLLDLRLRLGEGTGAALGMMMLDVALRIPAEMATFDSAGVSTAHDPGTS